MGNNVSELRTSPALLEALDKAARRKLTAEEILEQRASFVFGSMDENSNVTRERIKHVIAEHEGFTK